MNELFPEHTARMGGVVLKAEHLGTKNPAFNDVNFELHSGEILGIAGLVGSMRTELLETLFGSRAQGAGTIYYKGEPVRFKRWRWTLLKKDLQWLRRNDVLMGFTLKWALILI